MSAPARSWADYALFWHVYPLGFAGPEPHASGAGIAQRLHRLEAWLDYKVELGCSALALGPIFAADTHGYDTSDHFRSAARLGDDADSERLSV